MRPRNDHKIWVTIDNERDDHMSSKNYKANDYRPIWIH